MTRSTLSPLWLFGLLLLLAACAPQPAYRYVTVTPQPVQVIIVPYASPTQVVYPKVLGTKPYINAEYPLRPVFTLSFNQPMDAASVLAAVSVSPTVKLQVQASQTQTVVLAPVEPLVADKNYTFVLTTTAKGQNGLPLAQKIGWSYRPKPFSLSAVYPNDTKHIRPLQLTFNYPVSLSVTQQFQLTPALSGTLNFDVEKQTLTFSPTVAWRANATFQVVLGEGLTLLNGDLLPAPRPFTFTTPPVWQGYGPVAGAEPAEAAPWILFDRPMHQASVEAAFTLTPSLPGELTWVNNRLTFKPEAYSVPENTTFTVTLGTTALAADGRAMLKQPLTWTFTTGQYPHAVDFGAGPNAQWLNAAGTRIVPFVVEAGKPKVAFELYRLSLAQFVARYGMGFDSDPYYYWDEASDPNLATTNSRLAAQWADDLSTPLSQDGYGSTAYTTRIPTEVPAGLYILNVNAGPRMDDQLFLNLSRRALAAKWADGQLVAWVTNVDATPAANVPVYVYAANTLLLAQGQTDANGIFETALPHNPQPYLVVAGDDTDYTATGIASEWRSANNPAYVAAPTPLPAYRMYVHTDRPMYRPGQTVYFKALVRSENDAVLSLVPEGTVVTARLRDARNNVVRTIYLQTNAFGTVSSLFRIAEGAMLGDYHIEVEVAGESLRQRFKVQDYIKPDYTVTFKLPQTTYLLTDTLQGTVDSVYLFGTPVAGAKVTLKAYSVYRDCWEVCADAWYPLERELKGETDAAGQWVFSWPLKGFGAEDRLGLEVTVDDGSHQTVSALQFVQLIEPTSVLTLDTEGTTHRPGDVVQVQATFSDYWGNRLAGRKLSVEVYYSEYDYWYSDDQVLKTAFTTDAAGRITFPLTLTEAGYYTINVTGFDMRNKEVYQRANLSTFQATRTTVAPPALSVSVEHRAYVPGETVEVQIRSTVAGPALLTLERGTVRRVLAVTLTPPLTRVPLTLQATDVPNVELTVSAWQGNQSQVLTRTNGYGSYYQWYVSNSDYNLVSASTQLTLPATAKQLNLVITPERPTYLPGEVATFTVQVTNAQNQPVAAEVALAVVDEAIFSLSADLSADLFQRFYSLRDRRVVGFDSGALHRLLAGDYCDGCCECGGGGGGPGGPGPRAGETRSDFADTAFWIADLQTDANGLAIVSVQLPDNLTTWRVTARALTVDTQVGEAVTKVQTQQALMVLPLLPRTLVAGDVAELSALVVNAAPVTRTITVDIRANALLAVAADTAQTLTLGPGAQQMVGWGVTALTDGEASVTVRASSNAGDRDAVQAAVTVQPLAIPAITAQAGDFSGTLTVTFEALAGALPQSAMTLELGRSPAGSLLSGLEYLVGYPYGCVEQTMSRAFPNAVVARAFKQLGLTSEVNFAPYIDAGIQRLYGFQHRDGGWGWWHDDATDAYQTAWVIYGLGTMAQAGAEVDSGVVRRGAEWLLANLDKMDTRTRIFALYSVAAAGYGDLDRTRAEAKNAAQLDTFSVAALTLALQHLGAETEASALLEIVRANATREGAWVYWSGADADGHYHQKTMASSTRTTALALMALLRVQPEDALIGGSVRYLMGQRRASGWGSTNETSFAILALSDYLLQLQQQPATVRYTAQLNGVTLDTGALTVENSTWRVSVPVSDLLTGTNTLVLTSDGNVFYHTTTRMVVPEPELPAAGVVGVQRTYLDPATNKPFTRSVTAGELVKVQLTLTLPRESYYMLVEDKLPGGLAALNEGLNTTSHDGRYDDRCSDEWYCEEQEVFLWGQLGYNNKEVRAERVSFFITYLKAGQHTFTYYARALRAGTYLTLPAEASAMYNADFWGRSESAVLVVEEGK